MTDCAAAKSNCSGQTQGERNHLILQNLAKALWNVLKQYNQKLKVMTEDCVLLVMLSSIYCHSMWFLDMDAIAVANLLV